MFEYTQNIENPVILENFDISECFDGIVFDVIVAYKINQVIWVGQAQVISLDDPVEFVYNTVVTNVKGATAEEETLYLKRLKEAKEKEEEEEDYFYPYEEKHPRRCEDAPCCGCCPY